MHRLVSWCSEPLLAYLVSSLAAGISVEIALYASGFLADRIASGIEVLVAHALVIAVAVASIALLPTVAMLLVLRRFEPPYIPQCVVFGATMGFASILVFAEAWRSLNRITCFLAIYQKCDHQTYVLVLAGCCVTIFTSGISGAIYNMVGRRCSCCGNDVKARAS